MECGGTMFVRLFFKVKPAAHFSQNQITSDQPAVGGHLDKKEKYFGVLFIFIFILTMAMISANPLFPGNDIHWFYAEQFLFVFQSK
jgi:hypothetical protein